MYCLCNFLGDRYPGSNIFTVTHMRRNDTALVKKTARERIEIGKIQFSESDVQLSDSNIFGDKIIHFSRDIFNHLYANDAQIHELFEESDSIRAIRVFKDSKFVHGYGTIHKEDADAYFEYKIPSGNILIKIWFN